MTQAVNLDESQIRSIRNLDGGKSRLPTGLIDAACRRQESASLADFGSSLVRYAVYTTMPGKVPMQSIGSGIGQVEVLTVSETRRGILLRKCVPPLDAPFRL
jgi:hypothetical protein